MKRLLICDPMCVLSFGHNVSSLVYYRKYLSGRFEEVISLGAGLLDADLAEKKQIVRFFNYYYDAFVPISKEPKRSFQTLQHTSNEVDPLERISRDDIDRLFETFEIDENDSIFFPSSDFYGSNALLDKVSKLAVSKAPKLYLRFIGVMENACKSRARPADDLFDKIRTLYIGGYDINVAAETPPYADFLAESLNTCVVVAPYPETSAPMPLQAKSPFLIYAPGSARRDKGFFRLFDIFAEIRRRHPEPDIRFIMQTLPDRDIIYERRYLAQLYAMLGVTILPAAISDVLMQDIYKRSHLIILPYDPDIYRFRGSAVTFEAISAGRPILSEPLTGFATQIEYYRMGKLCSTPEEYAVAALEYYEMSPERVSRQCHQARTRFMIDTNATYQAWMQ